jgi:hypothetical protein
MTTTKQKLSFLTAAGLGLVSAISSLTPASAAAVAGCGNTPANTTLVKLGSFCQLTLATNHSVTFNLPAGVSALHGIMVGGGAGAGGVMVAGSTGYAGAGGAVQYFDFMGLADSAEVQLEVGAGGVSGDSPTPGQPSSVSVTGYSSMTGNGGVVGDINNYCSFGGNYSTYVGNNISGTGVAPVNANGICDVDGAPGENPAAGTDPNWATYPTTNLGKGGGVYATAPATMFPGEGGSVVVNTSNSTVTNTSGATGIIILRWEASTVVAPVVVKSKKLITTFAGDKPTLTSAMKSDISKWIKKQPANAAIVCLGSTSGKKVTNFDKSLAKARATNVCNYAKTVRSGISFTIKTNPSSANQPSARNVWMSYGY